MRRSNTIGLAPSGKAAVHPSAAHGAARRTGDGHAPSDAVEYGINVWNRKFFDARKRWTLRLRKAAEPGKLKAA